jgi:hypothetical protein
MKLDIRGILRRKSKDKSSLSREQLVLSRPVRNPYLKWERKEGGEVVISVPRDKSKRANVLSKLVSLPEYRLVQLDKVGADVWLYCDGSKNFGQIMDQLQEKHRLSRREAEVSLTLYTRKLMEKKFLALLVPGEKKEAV